MRRRSLAAVSVLWWSSLCSCLTPGEDRAELDRRVGQVRLEGLTLTVRDGLSAVRAARPSRVQLWAQSPVLQIDVQRQGALSLEVDNCLPGAVLLLDDAAASLAPDAQDTRSCTWELTLTGEHSLWIGPTDAGVDDGFAFAVLSDIQEDVPNVGDIFAVMNDDPTLRFVVSTGDLVSNGSRDELLEFDEAVRALNVPFYSTVGNHEMGAPPGPWHELFGPFSFHFDFKGVGFSLVDSGNATIDPGVYDRLDGWLAAGRDRNHMVWTHVPPLDPAGLRNGAFRSRKEGAKLLARLGQGAVDALFLGHIHSYYSFENAGVPSYISGGGGAIQERLDGIERHYLRVEASASGVESVQVVRVD